MTKKDHIKVMLGGRIFYEKRKPKCVWGYSIRIRGHTVIDVMTYVSQDALLADVNLKNASKFINDTHPEIYEDVIQNGGFYFCGVWSNVHK
jgi:hypothetical protein